MKKILKYFIYLFIALMLFNTPAHAKRAKNSNSQAPLSAPVKEDGSKYKIFVPDVRFIGIAPEYAQIYSSFISKAILELNMFEVVTSQDLQAQYEHDKLMQIMACDSVSCLAEIGGTAVADWILTCNITKFSDNISVALNLSSVESMKKIMTLTEMLLGDKIYRVNQLLPLQTKQLFSNYLTEEQNREIEQKIAALKVEAKADSTTNQNPINNDFDKEAKEAYLRQLLNDNERLAAENRQRAQVDKQALESKRQQAEQDRQEAAAQQQKAKSLDEQIAEAKRQRALEEERERQRQERLAEERRLAEEAARKAAEERKKAEEEAAAVRARAEGQNIGKIGNTMTDPRDGRKYKTVKIGDKIWMAENLHYDNISHYSAHNGSRNDDKYGYLYTWENAMKACPQGWRLPTEDEFRQLLTETGAGDNSSSIRASSWANGSNSSGFGALPAGLRRSNGFGSRAYFWSATPDVSDLAYYLFVYSDFAYVNFSSVNYAFSVRCLKD